MLIGYIGLGALGARLAERLLARHDLVVWDIRPEAMTALASRGAMPASTAADVARQCDIIFACLPRSLDVEAMLFGPQGLCEGLSPGKLFIDQTSGFPDATQRMAQVLSEMGVAMLDAPVSGSPQVVPQGGATLMVSGPRLVFERARPVLEALTSAAFHAGEQIGSGQALKMLNNAIATVCRLGTLEVVALGRKAGVSLEVLRDALGAGSARSITTERMLPAIAEGVASTNFAMALMLKDVCQALLLGSHVNVPMPLTALLRSLMETALALYGPDASLENLVDLVETMADVSLRGGASGAIDMSRSGGDHGAVGRSVLFVDYRPDESAARRLSQAGWTIRSVQTSPGEKTSGLASRDIAGAAVLFVGQDSRLALEETFAALRPTNVELVIDFRQTARAEFERQAEMLAEAWSVALVDARPCSIANMDGADTIACGGAPAAIERARPILAALFGQVVHCGPPGSGSFVALLNAAVTAICEVAAEECLAAGLAYGLEWPAMAQVLHVSSAGSVALRTILASGPNRMRVDDGSLRRTVADLRSVTETAMSLHVPVSFVGATMAILQQVANTRGATANLAEAWRFFAPGTTRSADHPPRLPIQLEGRQSSPN